MGLLTASNPTAGPLAAAYPERRWSSAEFDRLMDLGILREGGRAFLWDGKIHEPMAARPPHRHTCLDLVDGLKDRLGRDDWAVDPDSPLPLREGYTPQPDIAVYRGPRSAYRGRHPSPADAALLVEVSDTTYAADSGEMLRNYALVGIPQHWIVNIPAGRVEVYRNPRVEAGVGSYDPPAFYHLGESVPLSLRPGLGVPETALGAIPVADFLHGPQP